LRGSVRIGKSEPPAPLRQICQSGASIGRNLSYLVGSTRIDKSELMAGFVNPTGTQAATRVKIKKGFQRHKDLQGFQNLEGLFYCQTILYCF